MSQNTIAASAEGVMRNALEKIASGHRFNVAAMRPHEVHEVVFNALEAVDATNASKCEHTNSALPAEQAETVEDAFKMGVSAGTERAYAEVAQAIGYPEHWDTAAFPTVMSAVAGMVYRPGRRQSA